MWKFYGKIRYKISSNQVGFVLSKQSSKQPLYAYGLSRILLGKESIIYLICGVSESE